MKSLFKNHFSFSIVFLISFLIFAIPGQVFSQEFPEKPSSLKLVNDFAKIYSYEESNLLEEKLIAYSDKTSTQIAIVTITSLDGYPIDDYTIKLANKWQIGQKGKDNGLLILIAKEDRKIYIATGYGMEGNLNDGKLGTIIRTKIIPHFKNGDYYAGTNDGVDSIIAAAAGEYVNDEDYYKKKNKDRLFSIGMTIYVILFFIVFFYAYKKAKADGSLNRNRIFYGSSGGGGGGGFSGGGGFGGGSFGGGGAGGSW